MLCLDPDCGVISGGKENRIAAGRQFGIHTKNIQQLYLRQEYQE